MPSRYMPTNLFFSELKNGGTFPMVPHAESGGDASPSSPTERRGPILSYASREQCTFRPEVSEPLVNFKCLSWLTSMTLSPITGVYLQEK